MPVIELADVQAAARRLEGVAHRTPVFTSRTLDGLAGASVHVKAECFQRGGAFKFRGAFNKISSLDDDARARGVLAYSSGNHAQAVAIAAALLGSRATILMPEDAPVAKTVGTAPRSSRTTAGPRTARSSALSSQASTASSW
jgi:threonine dehydratase